MTIVTTTNKTYPNGDGIKTIQPFKYAAASTILTFTVNPAVDCTNIEIDNPSIGNPLQVQLIAKNSAGVDVLYPVYIIRSGQVSNVNFNEYIKTSGADLTQVIDRAIITIMKQDESAVAVAADVPTPFTVNGTLQNA
jgi:hypothetical protein